MTETITIKDNRTQKTYDLSIENNCIWARDLKQIKVGDARGLMSYDPAFLNTAACKSTVTFINGDKGILRYRGYPIEELAEKKSYLDIAYLLIHGELPTKDQSHDWNEEIKKHLNVNPAINNLICSLPTTSHPMALLAAAVSGLSAINPGAKNVSDNDSRQLQTIRLIAKLPTLAAWGYRHKMGLPMVAPDPSLSYCGNFLNMMFAEEGKKYAPHPAIERALDILFTLHADHEQNCSTTAMRVIGSSKADPYLCVAGSIGALSGPLHGGANEAVLAMLKKIGTKTKVADHIKRVKEGDEKLMGFGHRVYKNHDPRATVIKECTKQVFAVTGVNPLLEVAMELERIALEDEYFVSRKLYPNVDFYSGLIYEAMKIPTEMFTVLFAVARVSGWMAQWLELSQDADQKIARPRQVYLGRSKRAVVD